MKTEFLKLTKFIPTLALLAGCTWGPGDGHHPPGGGGGSCKPICTGKPSIYLPHKIDGGVHLRFDPASIPELKNPSTIAQIVLRVTVEEKKGANERDVVFSLNGITASRRDGRRGFDDDGKNRSNRYIFLEDRSLNGGEDIATFVARIIQNKGWLIIGVKGKGYKVVAGQLEIFTRRNCNPGPGPTPTPNPSPNPTPTPAPQVSITTVTPSEALTASRNISIGFTANQADATFRCALDSAAFTPCNSPALYSSLQNGAHVFKVVATNSKGKESAPATYNWTVDAVPPVVKIEPVASPTNAAQINVVFSANKTGIFYCALDGVTANVCVSPLTLDNLNEGIHNVAVHAIDSLGNTSDPSSVQFMVDRTAPVVQILSTTPSEAVSSSPDREVTFAADESATFTCTLDSEASNTCASPYKVSNLREGHHTIQVTAKDAAGNTSLPVATSWQSDFTPPVIELTRVLPQAGMTNASEYTVEFIANEASTFLCSLNGTAAVDCTSPAKGSFEVDGNHNLMIVAIDAAGLQSAPARVDWTVDRVAPLISFGAITPSTKSHINSDTLNLEIISTGPARLTASLNDVQLGDDVGSPIQLLSLDEGAYTLSVTGFDSLGNQTNTLEYKFVVDMTAPQVSVSSLVDVTGPTLFTSNTLTMTANEEVTYVCQLDSAGFAPCTNPITYDGLVDGLHTFEVRGIDLAGNESSVATVAWTIDTTAPVTDANAEQLDHGDFRFTFTANEPVIGYMCSLDNGPEANCSSPKIVRDLPAGLHLIKIRAIDLAGNQEQGVIVTVMATEKPVTADTILIAPNYKLTKETAITFEFSSGAPNATFLCSMDGSAFAACTTPVNFAALTDGQHTFRVKAVNSAGTPDPTGGKSFTWTIDSQAPILTVTATPDITKPTRETFASFALQVNEPATILCKLDSNAFTPCEGSITWDSLAGGDHSFQAKAKDAAGNESAVYMINWTIDLTPPVTSGTGAPGAGESGNFIFTFTANEPVQSFFCSVDGGPEAPCTSPHSVDGLYLGTHVLRVRAVDMLGNSEFPGTSITVNSTAPPPADRTSPVITSQSISSTSTSITVTWTTNEKAVGAIRYGIGFNQTLMSSSTQTPSTTNTITISGLQPGTLYSVSVVGVDPSSNPYAGPVSQIRTSNP